MTGAGLDPPPRNSRQPAMNAHPVNAAVPPSALIADHFTTRLTSSPRGTGACLRPDSG